MDFDEIPYNWRQPGTYLEVKPNYQNAGIFDWPERALLMGQKLAGGALAVGTVAEVTRPEDGIALFGRGSVGAKVVEAYRKANKTTPLYVMALADAEGAVVATGSLTFTGTVSAATVLRFKIGGRQVRITALTTDTLTSLAAKLVTAINSDLDMEVTAASAAGVVTCTARHGGEVGNEIDLRVDVEAQPLPPGLNCAIVAMAGGSGNPDIQSALDVLTSTWVTTVGIPWADTTNVTKLANWAKARYTATAKMDVQCFVFKRGTYGQMGTFGDLTNSAFLTCAGMEGMPETAYWFMASTMGVFSYYRTADPARQLRSLVVPNVTAPAAADQFLEEEKNLLLYHGISSFDFLADGTVTISRLITTYKKSSLNVDDKAWLDIMTPATLSRIRYDWSNYVSLIYPRAKLVDDETMAAFVTTATAGDDDASVTSSVVSPGRMHATWAARCQVYGKKVWIMDVAKKVKESVFAISSDDKNRLESRQQVNVAGNMMVLAGSLEFQV